MQKNILWVSRHPLWAGQKTLLLSTHGKKCKIEEQNFRFKNFEHFIDFLEQNQESYFVYLVVSEVWKQKAIDMGYSFGVVYKPKKGKMHNKKCITFSLHFFGAIHVQEKTKKKVLGSKGYSRPKTKNQTKRKAHAK